MSTKWRGRAAALTLALAVVCGQGVARAGSAGDGTYTVYNCQWAAGTQFAWVHTPASPGMGAWDDCAGPAGAVKVHAGVEPGGSSAFLELAQTRVDAPAGTHFTGAALTYHGYADIEAGWQSWIA